MRDQRRDFKTSLLFLLIDGISRILFINAIIRARSGRGYNTSLKIQIHLILLHMYFPTLHNLFDLQVEAYASYFSLNLGGCSFQLQFQIYPEISETGSTLAKIKMSVWRQSFVTLSPYPPALASSPRLHGQIFPPPLKLAQLPYPPYSEGPGRRRRQTLLVVVLLCK